MNIYTPKCGRRTTTVYRTGVDDLMAGFPSRSAVHLWHNTTLPNGIRFYCVVSVPYQNTSSTPS